MESARQQEQEQEQKQEQPTPVTLAAVIASGLASATVTVLTPYLPLQTTGALVAAAVMSMFTTAISTIYQGYLVEVLKKLLEKFPSIDASNKSARRLGVFVLGVGAIMCLIGIGAVTGVEVVVWVVLIGAITCLIGIGVVAGRKRVQWVLGVGAITCLIVIVAITGVEVFVGQTVPCWIGEKIGLGDGCSGDTQPSILGGPPIPPPNGSEHYWDDTADGDQYGAGASVEYVPGTQPSGWVTWGGDNCPDVANSDQLYPYDTDGDGVGDACDPP